MRLILIHLKRGFILNKNDPTDYLPSHSDGSVSEVEWVNNFNRSLLSVLGVRYRRIRQDISDLVYKTGFNLEENLFSILDDFSLSSMQKIYLITVFS